MKNVDSYLSKNFDERRHYLLTLSQEARLLFLGELAENMGHDKAVSLEDFLELDMSHRFLMTPFILNEEPTFIIEVFRNGVQLEKARTGGGRFGKERKFEDFGIGKHKLSFKKALVLIESYGEHVDFLSQRGKVREIHEAREKRNRIQEQPEKHNSKNQK